MVFRKGLFHLCLFFILFVSLLWGPSAHPGQKHPNILLITVDTLRADYVSLYNPSRGVTHALDKLASQGVIFERAFSHAPLTLPSHCSIFTGVSPAVHGVHDNLGYRLSNRFVTLAEWLKQQGYTTGAFVGAFPLDRRFGLAQGFDTYEEGYPARNPLKTFFPERRATAVVQDAIQWLKARDSSSPWFLWVHVFDPHQPYQAPEPFQSRFSKDPYGGEVAYADSELGRLIEFLQSHNLMDNTIVVFTADHGESLGDHGESTHGLFAYNETLHVPLIFRIPHRKAQQRIQEPVALSDIFPTLAVLLGQTPPSEVSGQNLMTLWTKAPKKNPAAQPIYLEALAPFLNRGWAPLTGLIWKNHKFIDLPIPELYDLSIDFKEANNLAPKSNLAIYRKKLQEISGLSQLNIPQEESSDTREALKSLGYIQSSSPIQKKHFTTADDPKTLLPIHQKFLAALQFYDTNDYSHAIQLLKEIITARNDMIVAYTYLSQFYQDIGDLRNAALSLQAALRVNSNNTEVLMRLGILRIEMGDDRGGIDILSNLTTKRGEDPDLWNHLGIAYWHSQNYEKAEQAFKKALSLDPSDPMIYNNLGNLRFSEKKFKEAFANFQKALALDPRLAAAYNGLGGCYLAEGKVHEALKMFHKAVEADPKYTLALFNLGTELYKAGRKSEALPYLERYMELAGPALSAKEFQRIESMIRDVRKDL